MTGIKNRGAIASVGAILTKGVGRVFLGSLRCVRVGWFSAEGFFLSRRTMFANAGSVGGVEDDILSVLQRCPYVGDTLKHRM